MSEVGLIMLGFGIAMLGTIIFILLVCFVAGDGLGLVFELTFFSLHLAEASDLCFMPKMHMPEW